jgi:excinuclease ABC subunit C
MRDEAHRFAITYHRSLRENILRESRLLKIPGIGAEREKKLLREFHSINAIMAAPVEEIMRVAGVSRNVAQAILELGKG